MHRRAALVLIAIPSLALASCKRASETGAVSDTAFIRTVIALRHVAQHTIDSTRRQTMRDSILRAHRVTTAQLETAARALAAQPLRAQRVWTAIDTATPGLNGGAAATGVPFNVGKSATGTPTPNISVAASATPAPMHAVSVPASTPAAAAQQPAQTAAGQPKAIRMEAVGSNTQAKPVNPPPIKR